MSKKITMAVSPNGDAKIEAFGYEGGSCVDATAELEALFGDTNSERMMKDGEAVAADMGERVR